MPRRLLLPQDDLRLPGLTTLGDLIVTLDAHQLYAVERWIVDRTAPLALLLVYTGDPAHSVQLHVYEAHADQDWLDALDLLAAHSRARPKHTADGVLLLTSLAHFPSHYTIVLLPDGRFDPPLRHSLYSNINLLRLAATRRTALTLDPPSHSTHERFLSTYHTTPSRVLALVALIQSALNIFGHSLPTDGLLCDPTLRAISHWVRLFATPSDRPVDPSFIALLLSLVLSTRNKLAHLGYSHLLPPDPFAHPTSLSPALAAYSQSHAPFIPLTNVLINNISASFHSKRLSRVIRTRLNSDSPTDSSTTDTILSPITTLPAFLATLSPSPDSPPDSLSALWSSPHPRLSTKPYRRHKQNHFSRGGVASDGDNARTKKYDGRSTEEESDPVHLFGGSLGNSFHWPPRRVKLRSWAGLTKRKHQSVDLTPRSDLPPLPLKSMPNSPQRERFRDRDRPLPPLPNPSEIRSKTTTTSASTQSLTVNTNFRNQRPSPSRRSTLGSSLAVPSASASAAASSIFSFGDAARAQSPTLPALQPAFFGDGDDEDLLSSGQVSPLSDGQTRPNPFYFSLGGSQAHLHTTAAQHSNTYYTPAVHSSSFSTNIGTGKQATYAGLGARTATPVTHQNLNIDEKMLARLLLDKGRGKRRDTDDTSGSGGGSGVPVGGRIASWAGPLSVSGWANDDDDDDDEEGSEISEVALVSKSVGMIKSKSISASASLVPPKDWGKEKTRFDNLVRVVDREGRLVEEEMDSEDGDDESGDESVSEYGNKEGREVQEDGWDGDSEELDEEEEERREAGRRRAARCVAKGELKRRRSFHDLDTFREIDVLSPERMKIDVELCGQCLIMWRRERHLRNVVDCVRLLASSLSKSNSLLRTHYQSHLPTLTSLSTSVTPNYASVYPSTTNAVVPSSNPSTATSRSSSPKPIKRSPFSSPPPGFSSSPPLFSHTPLPAQKQTPAHLLHSIDEASQQTERFSQATNTLLYQSEQFDVRGLWDWVGRERRKVWVLRGGVFGEGSGGGGNTNNNKEGGGDNGGREGGGQGQRPGRKLPEGVHGAHGSFNRLQWRLDGQGVIVDELGRTESEAEEEERVERGGSDVDGGVGARAVGEAGTSPKPGLVAREREHGREEDEGQGHPQPESKDDEIELEFLDRHLGIKPMWLLEFFTRWGARLSAATATATLATTSGSSEAAGAAAGVDANETTDAAGQGTESGLDVGRDLNPNEDKSVGTLSTNGGEELEELPFS